MHICARYFAEWLPYSCNLNLTRAKRTLRSPLMLTRMALIKKTNSRCWWVQWRKGALHIAGENVNSIHNGNQRQVPCKQLSPPGRAHKGIKVSKPQGYLHSHPCTWASTHAIEPAKVSIKRWMDMEPGAWVQTGYYSPTKKNGIKSFPGIWLELEIMVNKRSETHTNIFFQISRI